MLLSASLLGGICSAARADGLHDPKNFPACKVVTLPGGVLACAFVNLEDWKAVLLADAELTHQRALAKKSTELVENLSLQVASLEGQVSSLEGVRELLADRNKELTDELLATDKHLQQELAKPPWGSTIAWTVAAVSASLLVGFVGHELLTN